MSIDTKECPKCKSLKGLETMLPVIKKTKITVLDDDSISRNVNYNYYIQCPVCDIKTETYTTEERALEVWNKRIFPTESSETCLENEINYRGISRSRAYLAAGFAIACSNRLDDPIERNLLADAGIVLRYLLDYNSISSKMKPELYQHVNTGEIYEVICNANNEATGEPLIVYRNVIDGFRWVRPAKEFNDGRFSRIKD